MIEYLVLVFLFGFINSMWGVVYFLGFKEVIVIDIGGIMIDVGFIVKGFLRFLLVEIKIGGIRMNFSMLDVRSIGLGGGFYV